MMKRLYIAGGVVFALIIALKLHIHFKFLILPLAAALLYFYFPVLYRYYKNSTLQYAETHGTTGFRYPPALLKLLLTGSGVVLAFIIAVKLHISIKFLVIPLAAGVLYLYFPVLSRYYKNSMLQSAKTHGTTVFRYSPALIKMLLTGLAVFLAFIIAVKLHIRINYFVIPVAAAVLYLSYPVLSRHYQNTALPYAESHGIIPFHFSPPVTKALAVVLGVVLAYFVAVKLHINFKWLIVPLAAAILYLYFPVLYNYYKNSALRSEQDGSTAGSDSNAIVMQAFYVAMIVIPAFILAFELHIKFLMYPLAAAIFYLYVPLLYLHGKKSALQHTQNDGSAKLYSYLWFSAWFIVTCFFSYMLSHLLADVISSFHWSFFRYLLYVFILLIAGGLGIIVYLQWTSKKIDALGDIRMNFEKQGRLASFEILLTLLVVFLVKH